MAMTRMSAEDRREQIIRIAAELFARQGFKGTTTRQIAERAGITEALVFKYFDTKESLYTAIIEHKMQACTLGDPDEIREAAEARDDTGVFEATARTILESVRQDPTLMRLLLFSALEDHALSDLFMRRQIFNPVERLAQYIRVRIDDGAFIHVDPMIAARGFLGMINYQVLMRELFRHEAYVRYSVEELSETYARLFLNGLRIRPSSGKKNPER